MIPPFDQAEKIFPQDFEDHTDMDPIRPFVLEGVKEADDISSARMIRVCLDNFVQQLDFINGGFSVMRSGSDDFEGNVFACGGVSGEPDGGKVTPAKLPHNNVLSIVVGFANVNRVVATLAVVFRVFLVGGGFGGVFVGGGGGGRSVNM